MSTGENTVGTRPRTLRELREAAGASQSDVADRMGVNRQRVGHIEAKFPGIRFDVLQRYMNALGGHIRLNIPGLQVNLDELNPDPALAGTRDYLAAKASEAGVQRLKAEAAARLPAEELVLQSKKPQPGSDDPGRQIDHPDAQGDQGDSGQRQQP